MPFLVIGLVPEKLLQAWIALAHLTALCWYTKIDDLEAYLVCDFYFTGISHTDCV